MTATAQHVPELDAERAFLGALLCLGVAEAEELLRDLPATAFADERHGAILGAIGAAVRDGLPPDPIVVADRLRGEKLDVRFATDVRLVLHEMQSAVPLVANAPTYRRMVLDAAAARARQMHVDRLQQALRSGNLDTFDEIATQAPAPAVRVTRSSWDDEDLDDVLDGTFEPERPTLGLRSDSVPLLYRRRVHSLAGESEAGKSMLALHLVAQELTAGHDVVYIDLEDSKTGVVQRLLDLGVDKALIRVFLHYKTPTGALGVADEQAMRDVLSVATLVVLDAATEALSLYGYDSKDDVEVAKFYRQLPRRLADHGPAVLVIDHVVKDQDNRGRYATGSQHKLAAITGAAYGLEAVHPFAVGVAGRSRLIVHKDRPGQVRPHTRPIGKTGQRHWMGDFVVTPVEAGYSPLTAEIEPPATGDRPDFRPTVLMTKVSEALERAGKSLSSRDLLDRVQGRAEEVRRAIAFLDDDGYLAIENGPRNARLHRLIKPYPDPED
jgi:hypothetical protein